MDFLSLLPTFHQLLCHLPFSLLLDIYFSPLHSIHILMKLTHFSPCHLPHYLHLPQKLYSSQESRIVGGLVIGIRRISKLSWARPQFLHSKTLPMSFATLISDSKSRIIGPSGLVGQGSQRRPFHSIHRHRDRLLVHTTRSKEVTLNDSLPCDDILAIFVRCDKSEVATTIAGSCRS